ncbi:MAG TPA: condensation domain-containing protein, partial [Thermoanaerobaculia bacterium]
MREVAVLARPGSAGDRQLVAYVVARQGGAAPSLRALRQHAAESLPGYMLPVAAVSLPALPLSANGKVDRLALERLAPPTPAGQDEDGQERPRTPVEELIAGIWSQVLGVDGPIGSSQSFFDLGGHSLLATQVVSRLRQVLAIDLPLGRLFELPTLAAMAAEVERRMQRPATLRTPPLEAMPRGPETPLSFAQERLWFLDQLEPGSPAYNLPWAVRLTGRLEPPVLAAALGEVVRRHEILRSTFRAVAAGPIQVVSLPAPPALPCVDLSGLPPAAQEPAARRLAAAEAERPFDLAAGPPARFTWMLLGRTAAGPEHLLLLTLHHIVADAWSVAVLIRELAALYEAFSRGAPSPLPDLPLQYGDFAHWQRAWLRGDALGGLLDAWRRRLDGLPEALDLPADRPPPPRWSSRGASVAAKLPPQLALELELLGQRTGVTLFMTLLGAFSTLLARYCQQEDLPLGAPIANRHHREVEELIGYFVNTLVLRLALPGNPSFIDLLPRVRATALHAYELQDLPFERLVAELQPGRDASRSPLFQVMFTVEDAAPLPKALPALAFAPYSVATRRAKFDLTLTWTRGGGELAAALEYRRDRFDAPTAGRLLGHLRTLLAGIVANPGTPILDLPLLAESESAQLLREWNDTAASYPGERALDELFALQVRRTPYAAALLFGGKTMSFGELESRANRLAHRLRHLGVSPGQRVALLLPPQAETVVAMLAVLKAGATYLPLDPAQ